MAFQWLSPEILKRTEAFSTDFFKCSLFVLLIGSTSAGCSVAVEVEPPASAVAEVSGLRSPCEEKNSWKLAVAHRRHADGLQPFPHLLAHGAQRC